MPRGGGSDKGQRPPSQQSHSKPGKSASSSYVMYHGTTKAAESSHPYKGRRMSQAGGFNKGQRPLSLQRHSKPVNNSPNVMYHGTTKEAAESIKREGFRPSEDGMLGRGVYLSRDLSKASDYPLDVNPADRRVVEVEVDVGKVKKIDRQGHPLQKTWQTKDYDTAWVPPNCGMVASGREEDCVKDPSRIKVTKVLKPTSSQSHGSTPDEY